MKHNISFSNLSQDVTRKLVWLTDLHLDAVDAEKRGQLMAEVTAESPDALLIGGDMANGRQSLEFLQEFARETALPVYFVLGNHDYYETSISQMRNQATCLDRGLVYLSSSGVVPITAKTALIGHDGWSDAKSGDFMGSTVRLNDYVYINDLKWLSKEELRLRLNSLGEEAAEALKTRLLEAFDNFPQVIILTHSPPFEEICLYENRQTDDNWAPHFVCQSIGTMLKEVVPKFPDCEVILLCGHSHHQAESRILPNLKAYVGQSILGLPTIQGVISIE